MSPDPQANPSLPPNCTKNDVLRAISSYGPLLRIHRNEAHLPASPEHFRAKCRFRMSESWGNDKGYDKSRNQWFDGDHHSPQFHDIPWQNVIRESDIVLTRDKKPDQEPNANLRPRDDNNIYGSGNPNGLFFQRSRQLEDNRSGLRPTPREEVVAPVFIDIEYHAEYGLFRIMYWFFYELNHWHFMITHEGDWEHITQIYKLDDFKNARPPRWVYFAQHNQGALVGHNHLEKVFGTHPVIYVDKNGHPCMPFTKNPGDYTRTWKTWQMQLFFIEETEWRGYAGAWGEIGSNKHTTGPLGPLFKRAGDNIILKKHCGMPVVLLKR